jgi:hypothetical protein
MGSTWDFVKNIAWPDFKKLLKVLGKFLKGGFNFVTGKK